MAPEASTQAWGAGSPRTCAVSCLAMLSLGRATLQDPLPLSSLRPPHLAFYSALQPDVGRGLGLTPLPSQPCFPLHPTLSHPS